ncbi:MAG: hypothetical protein WA705_10400 [Candidatus Ozemobacteraceae bacterium]
MGKRLILGVLLGALLQPGLSWAENPFGETQREVSPGQSNSSAAKEQTISNTISGKSSQTNAAKKAVSPAKNGSSAKLTGNAPGAGDSVSGSKQGKDSTVPEFAFKAADFPGFYDASRDKSSAYNVPGILKDIPKMWKSYGSMFKKVGAELGVDPYALATFCIFESYNSLTHTYNPRMKDFAPKSNMYGAGIAATQAQDVKGTKVPGLSVSFPKDALGTAKVLWDKPEYAVRCLAAEFKGYYSNTNDLAKTFPKVAFPNWKPKASMGAYGTQAQYVSRAYVFYKAFRSADGK